jgi:hypothetical protein
MSEIATKMKAHRDAFNRVTNLDWIEEADALLLTGANAIERLVEQNNVLVRKCDPFLSSADLKAVDKHCDWVAFGHAYRAMLNARAALTGKDDE